MKKKYFPRSICQNLISTQWWEKDNTFLPIQNRFPCSCNYNNKLCMLHPHLLMLRFLYFNRIINWICLLKLGLLWERLVKSSLFVILVSVLWNLWTHKLNLIMIIFWLFSSDTFSLKSVLDASITTETYNSLKLIFED